MKTTRPRRLKRREVTDADMRAALADPKCSRNMRAVLARWRGVLPEDQLEGLGLLGVWEALECHDYARQELASSVWRFVNWQCTQLLRKLRRQARRDARVAAHLLAAGAPTAGSADSLPDRARTTPLAEEVADALEHVRHDWQRRLLRQAHLEGRPLEEIARTEGTSAELVKQRLASAEDAFRRAFRVPSPSEDQA